MEDASKTAALILGCRSKKPDINTKGTQRDASAWKFWTLDKNEWGRPDVEMVRHGIIRARLPAENPVRCTLHNDGVREAASDNSTTRSAAAVDLWGDALTGAVVAIGNAPTALYRVLELIEGGAAPPAMIAAFPVGFVGAAESKDALIAHAPRLGVPYITLKGRRGGSALAAACINGLVGQP